jgi:AmmeMemoRadiSam system protein B
MLLINLGVVIKMGIKAFSNGMFYPADNYELQAKIKELYLHDKGPGEIPGKRGDKVIKGVVVPHAGYEFSGACAAFAYEEIAKCKFPDLFIMLAPNHKGNGNFTTLQGLETPFGNVRIDQDFARVLMKRNNQVVVNDEIFKEEHSIDVQLPMLQQATNDRAHELKILPILVSNDVDIVKLGLDISEALIDMEKEAVFVVSSDFTHYGRKFHYVPFLEDVANNVAKMDKDIIDFLKARDLEGLADYAHGNKISVCGLYAMLIFMKAVNYKKCDLLQYYNSDDLKDNPSYREFVSYASLVFE